jgi:hypothetical protein
MFGEWVCSVALSGLGVICAVIQGPRTPLRYALAPGYLLPRLRRWFRPTLDHTGSLACYLERLIQTLNIIPDTRAARRIENT